MQLGLGFGLGVCPSSIIAKKIQHQKTHCFLSKHPQIALAWTWSRGALKGSMGWSGWCRVWGEFLFSGRQESRVAGSRVGKELGPVRAAHARQEAAAAWMDTRRDAVAAPTPSAPAAVQSSTGEHLEG